MITLQGLTKRFDQTVAVDSVSLSIPDGQMVGVIGRSGAGKSTLLRVINRLTPASEGSVVVNDRNILALRGAAMRAWQRDCAMIFQQFNLVPRLDVVTNVILGRANRQSTLKSLFKIFSEQDIGDALDALDRLGIAEQALQRAETLSGGQQQRVAIARALMQRPKLILADEPIASLDPLSAEVVMTSLREIHDRDDMAIICNLHTLDTARQFCDRIIGMRAGKVVFDGTASELTEAAARDIYGADHGFQEAVTSMRLTGTRTTDTRTAPSTGSSEIVPA